MKKLLIINNTILRSVVLCLFVFWNTGIATAQDAPVAPAPTKELVKNTFGGVWILDNQTYFVPNKGTFEMDIQHRFGTVNNGYKDLFGLYAPSNIRLAFAYTPIDHLTLGFGFCKENLTWDLNAKVALMRQSKGGGWPVSVSYFGNMAIDTRAKINFFRGLDRYSYFNQLMIARKITKNFSAQVAPSISHFNNVVGYINKDGQITPKMKNEHIAIAFMGRYKISKLTSVMVNYDQPLTQHTTNNPHPNISAGIEMSTSGHSFQIFAGNYSSIIPQYNNFYNRNQFEEGQFLIGFNITRLWSF